LHNVLSPKILSVEVTSDAKWLNDMGGGGGVGRKKEKIYIWQ